MHNFVRYQIWVSQLLVKTRYDFIHDAYRGVSGCESDWWLDPLLCALQHRRRRPCFPPAVARCIWWAAIWRCSKPRTFARKSTATSRRKSRRWVSICAIHAGFSVTVPLKELAGEENSLTILFRVTPLGQSAEPAYFIQRYTVPQHRRGRRRRRAAARIARSGRRQLSRGLADARPPPAGVLVLLGYGSRAAVERPRHEARNARGRHRSRAYRAVHAKNRRSRGSWIRRR